MKRDPVRIAGGGLSGLMTAYQLARRGIGVDLYERRHDSGAAHRTRYDAIENWSTRADFRDILSDWAIESLELRPASTIHLYDFNGDCYPLTLKRPLFYLVKRGTEADSLEQTLKQQALDLGVRMHYGTALARDQADVWAVGSQGRGFFLAAGITFRTSSPDVIMILVDQRLAPKAYAYLIVVEGQATLTVVLTRQFDQARDLLQQTIEAFRRFYPFDLRDVQMSSGIGGSLSAFRLPSSASMAVGEAAGLQDYLWGFGIRHALHSGVLAAQAIAENIPYERLLAQEIRPLVQSSLIDRRVYDTVNNDIYRILIRRISATQNVHGLLYHAYHLPTVRSILWSVLQR